MKKLGQKGFGAVEGLLAVIAIALVVGVGFYVVNANKDDKKSETATSTSQKNETKPTEQKKDYLEVKELGIKVPSKGIESIGYKLSDGSTPDAKVYIFSDSEITKKVNSCRLSGEKFEEYELYEIFRGNGKFNPNREAGSTTQLLKQFDDFYIAYIGQPNFSSCTDTAGTSVDNTEVTTSTEQAQANLSKAFEGSEKL